MKKCVLSVGDRKPVHIEIMNVDDNVLVSGELRTYRLDYDLETSAVVLRFSLQESDMIYSLQLGEAEDVLATDFMTPQEIFFAIVGFLGEVIHSAKSFGRTLAMKLDNDASRVYVKDLLNSNDSYRVFMGTLTY